MRELQAENPQLRALLKGMAHQAFGSRSERASTILGNQGILDLGDLVTTPAAAANDDGDAEGKPAVARPRRKRGLMALPAHIERVERVIDPDTLDCPCCAGKLHRIGEDASEALDWVPVIVRVIRTVRRTILKRYNRICIELAEKPEAYAPIYMRTEEGEVLLEDFANGFFTAMHLDMEAWKPFIADPEFGYPLAALLGHSTITGGPSWIEQLGDPRANLALADTWRMVPQIISLIHDQCAFARMTPAA
nr:UPF0149 family protein [Novosphingobium sp. P6W]